MTWNHISRQKSRSWYSWIQTSHKSYIWAQRATYGNLNGGWIRVDSVEWCSSLPDHKDFILSSKHICKYTRGLFEPRVHIPLQDGWFKPWPNLLSWERSLIISYRYDMRFSSNSYHIWVGFEVSQYQGSSSRVRKAPFHRFLLVQAEGAWGMRKGGYPPPPIL